MDVIGKPLGTFLEIKDGEEEGDGGEGPTGRCSARLVRKDGSHRAVISLATPLKDSNARVHGTIHLLCPTDDDTGAAY